MESLVIHYGLVGTQMGVPIHSVRSHEIDQFGSETLSQIWKKLCGKLASLWWFGPFGRKEITELSTIK